MRQRGPQYALLFAALLLAAAADSFAQQPAAQGPAPLEDRRRAVSYTFVSPNTREGLTLADAVKLLDSPEEFRLLRGIRALSRCLGLKPAVLRTVGSWSDGAEHSALFRVYADLQTLRYADARLGKSHGQKTVLFFRRDPAGTGVMYVLYARRGGLHAISRALDESGVEFRTLAPGRRRRPAAVYVVDLRNELRGRVFGAARRLRARVLRVKGSGGFIGDETDRERARRVFSEEVERYEALNPRVARRCARQ